MASFQSMPARLSAASFVIGLGASTQQAWAGPLANPPTESATTAVCADPMDLHCFSAADEAALDRYHPRPNPQPEAHPQYGRTAEWGRYLAPALGTFCGLAVLCVVGAAGAAFLLRNRRPASDPESLPLGAGTGSITGHSEVTTGPGSSDAVDAETPDAAASTPPLADTITLRWQPSPGEQSVQFLRFMEILRALERDVSRLETDLDLAEPRMNHSLEVEVLRDRQHRLSARLESWAREIGVTCSAVLSHEGAGMRLGRIRERLERVPQRLAGRAWADLARAVASWCDDTSRIRTIGPNRADVQAALDMLAEWRSGLSDLRARAAELGIEAHQRDELSRNLIRASSLVLARIATLADDVFFGEISQSGDLDFPFALRLLSGVEKEIAALRELNDDADDLGEFRALLTLMRESYEESRDGGLYRAYKANQIRAILRLETPTPGARDTVVRSDSNFSSLPFWEAIRDVVKTRAESVLTSDRANPTALMTGILQRVKIYAGHQYRFSDAEIAALRAVLHHVAEAQRAANRLQNRRVDASDGLINAIATLINTLQKRS